MSPTLSTNRIYQQNDNGTKLANRGNAARVAVGLGAQVTVLDISHARLKYLDDIYCGQLQPRISNESTIEEAIETADPVIGAILIHGGRAPWLITRDMLPTMRRLSDR